MVSVAIHGGAGEIGGNKILIRSRDAGVFLDFGISFASKRRYFGTFLQPPAFALVNDFLLTGVIPRIVGLYKLELLKYGEAKKLKSGEKAVDAVLISHAHLDHIGHVSLIDDAIPLYLGEGTKVIAEAREESRTSSTPETRILKGREKISTFRTGHKIRVGDQEITPVHVDHSVPAAYGFYVEACGSSIAYTGDIRVHGPMGVMTRDFITLCSNRGVDTLIIEGTRIGDNEVHSEEEVSQGIANELKQLDRGLAVIMMGLLDFDRLKSVIRACEENGRELVLPLRQAYLLDKMRKHDKRLDVPKFSPEYLTVYYERKGSGEYQEKDYRGWARKFISELKDAGMPLVKDEEINRSPRKYALVINNPEDVLELGRVNPPSGSLFILSTSEPHNEEQVIEMEKIKNWINLFNMRFAHIHASGHASSEELLSMVEEINPKAVIPIHTERPDYFKKLIEERIGSGCKVILPEKDKMIQLV